MSATRSVPWKASASSNASIPPYEYAQLPSSPFLVVRVEAVGKRGVSSRPHRLTLHYDPPQRELYLLAIGVGDYADDRFDLSLVKKDVETISATSEAQKGIFYKDVHVTRLVDGEVSNGALLRARDEFLPRATLESLADFAKLRAPRRRRALQPGEGRRPGRPRSRRHLRARRESAFEFELEGDGVAGIRLALAAPTPRIRAGFHSTRWRVDILRSLHRSVFRDGVS